jgi:hypothetical protein
MLKKRLDRDCTMSSNYIKYTTFNSKHNGKGLSAHLLRKKTFAFTFYRFEFLLRFKNLK